MSNALSSSRTPTLYHLSFNQDYTCFAAGLDIGFRIFNTDSLRLTRSFENSTDFEVGGIGIVATLFKVNQFCFVGGGPDPNFSHNKVMLWEISDYVSRCKGEISLRTAVKNVKFRRDKIIVVLLQKIYVYNCKDFKLFHQIETDLNVSGVCEVSANLSPLVLACPGLVKGQIRVENFESRKVKFIMAHNSAVACLSLTYDGRYLASASTKGTLIRVFNALNGSLLQEVRRGADRAEIYSLAFSFDAQWLAITSDKGTAHVFGLKVDSGLPANDKLRENKHPNGLGISSLSIFKGVLPKYFNSEWSVAKFRLPEGVKYLAGFGQQTNTIVIIGMDGSFYRCEFDPVNGGQMTQLECLNFLKP